MGTTRDEGGGREMDPLWLLKGPYEAPGWGPLEKDSKANKTDVVLFDRGGWALVRAPAAPAYEGLPAATPADGLYLDDQGRGIYVLGGVEVASADEILATRGQQAQELMKKYGDADTVLERLGLVY
jgi:hypothetical protein